ncbi:BglII/BstYI family type II restriction endonuclease [Bacillus siamensis]|uniref:BglII/BstYI family type II restriction endonuclease n=1 Tax=Bacillus siamensis TaxID=659243 RepID=UPI0022B7B7EE|nr:BglII/BstYI family type II restriction endonuclease [Bacillus siamensis]
MTNHSETWIQRKYHIDSNRNGLLILKNQYPHLWHDIVFALRGFRLLHSEIVHPGGGKSLITQRLEKFFKKKSWRAIETKESNTVSIGRFFGKPNERVFNTINLNSQTHEIDLFKDKVAIEIEWNNKHQFFSRDLEAFDYLYKAGIIDVGVIITKHTSLHTFFESLGYLISTKKRIAEKYASTHTHTEKLYNLIRTNRCSCPLVIIGITNKVYKLK